MVLVRRTGWRKPSENVGERRPALCSDGTDWASDGTMAGRENADGTLDALKLSH